MNFIVCPRCGKIMQQTSWIIDETKQQVNFICKCGCSSPLFKGSLDKCIQLGKEWANCFKKKEEQ